MDDMIYERSHHRIHDDDDENMANQPPDETSLPFLNPIVPPVMSRNLYADDDLNGLATPQTTIAPMDNGDHDNPQTQQIPSDIIVEIISCVVADGLGISNDPAAADVNIKNIQSLLKTTRAVSRETFRQVFRHPLHLYLFSVKTCPCEIAGGWVIAPQGCSVIDHLRLLGLPLYKWTELAVHFNLNACEVSKPPRLPNTESAEKSQEREASRRLEDALSRLYHVLSESLHNLRSLTMLSPYLN